MNPTFRIAVYGVTADRPTLDLIQAAYGTLGDRVDITVLEHDELKLPSGEAQPGACVLVASSHLLRQWFGGAAFARAISGWHSTGGKALVVHPDTSSGLLNAPQLELGHIPVHARDHALREFLDLPHDLTLRFDATDEDDTGSLDHARGVVAWERRVYEDAIGHFESAVRARSTLHEGDPRRAASENALGATLARTGQLDLAMAHLEQARRSRRAWLGSRSPQAAVSSNNVGVVLLNLGESQRAAVAFVEAADAFLQLGRTYEEHARASAAHAATALGSSGDQAGARTWAAIARQSTVEPSTTVGLILN